MVSEATRTRVLEVVQRTGYWSNPHASALRSGRSTIVAVFVSNLSSQQYTAAAQACAQVIEDHGLQMMVGQTSYSYSRELSAIQSLRALRPAAVFFTGVIELEENRQVLRDLNIPIVESWAHPRDPIDMLVGFSNVDAGRLAASHLAERGFRRPAFIGRSGGRGKLRLQGFSERLAEHGISVASHLVVDRVGSIEDGRTAFRQLQDSGAHFDSIFCANDLLALGVHLGQRRGAVPPVTQAPPASQSRHMAGSLLAALALVVAAALAIVRAHRTRKALTPAQPDRFACLVSVTHDRAPLRR
jgi:LacI family gluconate utilization system Gnt-I transcriptional repressor